MNYGPIIGATNGIYILDNCNKTNENFVKIDGTVYECDPQYKCSLFVNTGSKDDFNYFTVDEIEVYTL